MNFRRHMTNGGQLSPEPRFPSRRFVKKFTVRCVEALNVNVYLPVGSLKCFVLRLRVREAGYLRCNILAAPVDKTAEVKQNGSVSFVPITLLDIRQ
jgi:hypothetical protein